MSGHKGAFIKYFIVYNLLVFSFTLFAHDYSGFKVGEALQGTYDFMWFTSDLGDMAIQAELKLQNGKYSFALLNRRADYKLPEEVKKEFQFARKLMGSYRVKYLENFNENILLSNSELGKREDKAFAVIDFYPFPDDKKLYSADKSDLSFRFFLHYNSGIFFFSHSSIPQPKWIIKKDFNPKKKMHYY